MRAAMFSALGEPNRLQIVELLGSGSLAVGEITEALRLRQPQVSKHLKVLTESGIVSAERRGRRRIYQLQAEPFHDIVHWVDSFEHLWDVRLSSLGHYLQSSKITEDES